MTEAIGQVASVNALGGVGAQVARNGAKFIAELRTVDTALPEFAIVTSDGVLSDTALIEKPVTRYMTRSAWEKATDDRVMKPGRGGFIFATNEPLMTDPILVADRYGMPYVPEVAVTLPPMEGADFAQNGVAKMLRAADDQVIRLGGGDELVRTTKIRIPKDPEAAGFKVIDLEPPACRLPDAVELPDTVVPDLMPPDLDLPKLWDGLVE